VNLTETAIVSLPSPMRRGSAPFLLIAASVSRTRAARRRGGFVGVDRRLFAARLARPHAISAAHCRSAHREASAFPGPVAARSPVSARGRSRGAGRLAMVLCPQLSNSATATAVTEQHERSTPVPQAGSTAHVLCCAVLCCAVLCPRPSLSSQGSRTIAKDRVTKHLVLLSLSRGKPSGHGLLGPSRSEHLVSRSDRR
jgi:hypothetical protein